MELVKYDFDVKDLPNGVLTIIPLGDIQWDGSQESSALRLLKETIAAGSAAGAFYIGMGDYTDFLSPSNRDRLKAANLYDTAGDVIERTGETLINEIEETLAPTRGRWLGMLEGHHYQDFADGTTSDMRLAQKLRARHLGSSAYIGITFNMGMKSVLVNIWATHGMGGGNSAAGPINKLDNITKCYEADIYLIGHMTKMAHAPVNRIYPSWFGKEPDLHHKDIHLVGTGGFSRGLQVGRKQGLVPRGTYVEQGMMRPTALGSPTITIRPHRIRQDQHDTLTRQIHITL